MTDGKLQRNTLMFYYLAAAEPPPPTISNSPSLPQNLELVDQDALGSVPLLPFAPFNVPFNILFSPSPQNLKMGFWLHSIQSIYAL